VVEAVEAAGPAVVNISTEKIITMRPTTPTRDLFDDEFEKYYEKYRQSRDVRARSLGSGVLIDPRGYIVTNEHVVRRASRIQVTLKDKNVYPGRLISADPSRDLAVIRIMRPTPFPTARMTRRDPLLIGETAIAVGNPFGFEHTVTVGVISATGRSVTVNGEQMFQNLVQTDAAINPGNSGGALLDVNGELIGINTAIKADAQGLGFAIPVEEVRKALVDLLDFRRLSKVSLGIGLVGLVRTDTNEPVGMRVIQIQEKSAGDKAGFKYGDIITKLNGHKCVDIIEFEIDILEHREGDKLVFEGVRGDQPFRAEMTLERLQMADPNAVISQRMGLTVAKMTENDAKRVDLDPSTGLIVREVNTGTAAAVAGFRKDDVIVLLGNFRVSEPEELAALLQKANAGEKIIVVLIRGGVKYYTWITLR
jgi:serine protease Do